MKNEIRVNHYNVTWCQHWDKFLCKNAQPNQVLKYSSWLLHENNGVDFN